MIKFETAKLVLSDLSVNHTLIKICIFQINNVDEGPTPTKKKRRVEFLEAKTSIASNILIDFLAAYKDISVSASS